MAEETLLRINYRSGISIEAWTAAGFQVETAKDGTIVSVNGTFLKDTPTPLGFGLKDIESIWQIDFREVEDKVDNE